MIKYSLYTTLTFFIILVQGKSFGKREKKKHFKDTKYYYFLVDDMGWQDCSVPFYRKKNGILYIIHQI
jgi:hypothetical protein